MATPKGYPCGDNFLCNDGKEVRRKSAKALQANYWIDLIDPSRPSQAGRVFFCAEPIRPTRNTAASPERAPPCFAQLALGGLLVSGDRRNESNDRQIASRSGRVAERGRRCQRGSGVDFAMMPVGTTGRSAGEIDSRPLFAASIPSPRPVLGQAPRLCSVVAAELWFGSYRSGPKNQAANDVPIDRLRERHASLSFGAWIETPSYSFS